MTVASFFRKYSVGCILNYLTLIITRGISCIYSERQNYGINSLKIKQNFFQKNLWTGQF
jgi:hypothetical protein